MRTLRLRQRVFQTVLPLLARALACTAGSTTMGYAAVAGTVGVAGIGSVAAFGATLDGVGREIKREVSGTDVGSLSAGQLAGAGGGVLAAGGARAAGGAVGSRGGRGSQLAGDLIAQNGAVIASA